MKKILSIIAVLLIMTGCTNARVDSVSNKTLFSINGTVVTEKEQFNYMKHSDAASKVMTAAQNLLLNDIVEETEEFKARVQTEFKSDVEKYGDSWETLLQMNGIKSDEEYIETYVKPRVQLEYAIKAKMNDSYDLLQKKNPRQARVLQVESANVEAAMKRAKEGEALSDIAKDLGVTNSLYRGATAIFSTLSALDANPLNTVLTSTEKGLVAEAVKGKSSEVYYIVDIVEIDSIVIKNQVITEFYSEDTVKGDILATIFKDNGFKVYDIDIYNYIQKSYSGYLSN